MPVCHVVTADQNPIVTTPLPADVSSGQKLAGHVPTSSGSVPDANDVLLAPIETYYVILSASLTQWLELWEWEFLVMSYRSEMWSVNMGLIRRLEVTQRAMERAMLGVVLREPISNEEIRRRELELLK
ncbi:jg7004 [Pararge aegeria aegeria]|uniref:Jg7004 protein n=1 Tax=Pararge aegeria aegeria TaxID=348720 RepID=A0A8S4SE79_9NEOP|nr:jg7004 [Pararge aegeria aegeria]